MSCFVTFLLMLRAPPPMLQPALAQVKLRQCLLSEWLLLENDTLLPCLRELDLSGNRLTSLTSLMACPVLASLDISNNRFADAAGVAEALRCHVLFLERLSCTAHLWAPNELLPHLSSASMSNEGSIRLTPAAFAEDDWPAGGQRLKYLLESSRQSSSDSASAAGSVTQEMAFILQRWLCCLADWSTGPHNTQALVQRQAQKLSPPQPTAAQTAMMVSRVVRLQAWWRGTLVRLRLGRLLTTLDDGSGMGNSLVMEGDVDLSEFDAGLDAVDRDFGDLRPPTAILRCVAFWGEKWREKLALFLNQGSWTCSLGRKSRPAPVRAPATRVERAKVSAWATRDAPTPTELGELSDAKPALAANSRVSQIGRGKRCKKVENLCAVLLHRRLNVYLYFYHAVKFFLSALCRLCDHRHGSRVRLQQTFQRLKPATPADPALRLLLCQQQLQYLRVVLRPRATGVLSA